MEQPKNDQLSNDDVMKVEHEATTPFVDNNHALADTKLENNFASANAALAKEKTKRRSKPLLVFAFALLMALLGAAAGILVYIAYFQKTPTPQPTTSDTTKTTSATSAKLTAAGVIDLVKAAYPGTTAATEVSTPPIKVAGYGYYSSIDASKLGTGLTKTVSATQAPVDTATVTKVLVDKGFTQKTIQDGSGDTMLIEDFAHKDVVCRLGVTKTANNPAGPQFITLSCANMSDYVTVADAAKPLDAVVPAGQAGANVLYGQPTFTNSKTTGYALATMSGSSVTSTGDFAPGGAMMLFYQTVDKTWHYFTSAQGELSCDQYNTPDLKKAYLGTACGDSTGKPSTVSL